MWNSYHCNKKYFKYEIIVKKKNEKIILYVKKSVLIELDSEKSKSKCILTNERNSFLKVTVWGLSTC